MPLLMAETQPVLQCLIQALCNDIYIPSAASSGSGLMFRRNSYYLLITEEFLIEEVLLAPQFMPPFPGPCLRVTQGKRMENHMHPVSWCSSVSPTCPIFQQSLGKFSTLLSSSAAESFQGLSQFSFSRRNRILPGEKNAGSVTYSGGKKYPK